MAIHSSTLAWKIPWTEEPDRLQSMGSQRLGHDVTFHLHVVPMSNLPQFLTTLRSTLPFHTVSLSLFIVLSKMHLSYL